MVESLIQLKKLSVLKCKAMEQIVTKAVGEDGRLKNIISFPKLESLELQHLPKLKRFCEGDCIEFPSLSKLIIWACYELRTFIPSSHESTVTLLRAIEERELEAQQTLFNEKVVATKLTNLGVWKCHGLISLFNSSTATSLAQLTRVFIGKCNQMTQVIHVNDQMEDESAAESEIVFSLLKILALHHLPNLKCFHSGNNKLQFPNLEKINLGACPEMRSFSHGTINTPNLDRLIIAELDRRLEFYVLDWFFINQEEAKPIEELWEGDLNRSIRKLWDDSYIALQWIFSEIVDDHNSKEDTAGHDQKIQHNKENAASSSSK
ncbi:hypothetical protein TIFTF001_035765 [Ficus carica]|uniref:Disease resistance protein At4g27190-like leucine-rich repeats domain-containing protein n=1 Tax=Ficus carica TaxID=3494 RepID=A0AA88E2Z6_FICCA|nr:hypothetical protein TIFTF001_041462 [Ficus carica]GMN66705.1 hypothetical protein TIFTF001_035765 [Ficus carica]